MIELSEDQYYIARSLLQQCRINTSFCHSVIAGHISGQILINSLNQPTTIYVLNDYGMSLLYGDYQDPQFNQDILDVFSSRRKDEWLQIDPPAWHDVLLSILDNSLTEHFTRQNFEFDVQTYNEFKYDRQQTRVVETTLTMIKDLNGDVVPSAFWDNLELFMLIGKSFSTIQNGEAVSTAFSAFLDGRKLEIGIETKAAYRGLGYATAACVALIDYCLNNGLTPEWSCRLENKESMRLAIKLGFKQTRQAPYFHIYPRESSQLQ